MNVRVEFLGLIRHLTNMKEVDVDLSSGSTLRELAVSLSRKFPDLICQIITAENFELQKPYAFSINGQHVAQDLSPKIREGDSIILFSADSGG